MAVALCGCRKCCRRGRRPRSRGSHRCGRPFVLPRRIGFTVRGCFFWGQRGLLPATSHHRGCGLLFPACSSACSCPGSHRCRRGCLLLRFPVDFCGRFDLFTFPSFAPAFCRCRCRRWRGGRGWCRRLRRRRREERPYVVLLHAILLSDGSELREEVPVRWALELALHFPAGVALKRPVAFLPAHEAHAVVPALSVRALLAFAVGGVVESQTAPLLLLLPLQKVRHDPPFKT